MSRLLAALIGSADFEMVKFQNQPSKGGKGVPDALILASTRLYVETKTAKGAVKSSQLVRHLKRLDDTREENAILLLLTPDFTAPKLLSKFAHDERLVWASFAMLSKAIDEILEEDKGVVSEREAFLLREFQSMLMQDSLVANENEVVIVAARKAWQEYNDYAAYICQPNRSFRSVIRMGFYSNQQIYPLIPTILEIHQDVEMVKGQHKGKLGQVVNAIVENQHRKSDRNMIVILSSSDSKDTIRLNQPISNTKVSKTGGVAAFTMGQRYVSLDKLTKAETTSDLE